MQSTVFRAYANSCSNVALTHAFKGQHKDSMTCANRCKTGHCLENLLKSEISVKPQKQAVLKYEVETHGTASKSSLSVTQFCKLLPLPPDHSQQPATLKWARIGWLSVLLMTKIYILRVVQCFINSKRYLIQNKINKNDVKYKMSKHFHSMCI